MRSMLSKSIRSERLRHCGLNSSTKRKTDVWKTRRLKLGADIREGGKPRLSLSLSLSLSLIDPPAKSAIKKMPTSCLPASRRGEQRHKGNDMHLTPFIMHCRPHVIYIETNSSCGTSCAYTYARTYAQHGPQTCTYKSRMLCCSMLYQ